MARHPFRGVGIALVIATLLLGAFAAPAAAANPTRWVDDNAGGNGGPAACATAAFTSIQAAINASANWDHVYVCPGTYHEQLVLDVKGIDVRAMPGRAAHIVPPFPLAVDGVGAVVRMTAWAARLTGFRIDIPAGAVPTVSFSARSRGGSAGSGGSVPSACSHVDVAVLVLGQRNRVRRNVIDGMGDATYSGTCGYDYGIVFGQHAAGSGLIPPFEKLGVSRAVRNIVRDFKSGGILVEGATYSARVDHNTVEFLHADDPGCPLVNSIVPCFIILGAAPSIDVNGAFALSFGVGVEDGATGLVESNTVNSTYGQVNEVNTLSWGVALMGADDASRVVANTIDGVQSGVYTNDQTITPPVRASAVGEGGAAIYNNTITNGGSGLEISDDGHVIYGNQSHTNDVGIQVDGIDNDIHDNDFRSNALFDCADTSPAGTGTANTSNLWTNDLGNSDLPDGICTPDET